MKKCSICEDIKPLNEFNKDSQKSDGKQSFCRLCNSIKCKSWRKSNPNKHQSSVDNWKGNNMGYMKLWKSNNPNYHLNWFNDKIQTNPIFKLKHNTRSLIWSSFKRFKNQSYFKDGKTEGILGCSLEEFIQHLQLNFIEGMTLENYGEWELDHIIPLATAKNKSEILKLNHYTNFQPLWKEDNRKKGAKLLGEVK